MEVRLAGSLTGDAAKTQKLWNVSDNPTGIHVITVVSNYALSRTFLDQRSRLQTHSSADICATGVSAETAGACAHTPMAPWCSASLIRCSTCLFFRLCGNSTGWKSFLGGLSLVSNTLLEREALLPTQRGYRDSRLPYCLPKWVVLWGYGWGTGGAL